MQYGVLLSPPHNQFVEQLDSASVLERRHMQVTKSVVREFTTPTTRAPNSQDPGPALLDQHLWEKLEKAIKAAQIRRAIRAFGH